MVYVLYMTSPESLEAAGFVQVFQRAAPAAYLDRLSLEHGLTVRRGIYSLAAVIWLMIFQRLNSKRTLSSAVQWLVLNAASLQPQSNLCKRVLEQRISARTGGYCQARQKLPTLVVTRVTDHLFEQLQAQMREELPDVPRPMFVIDGTTLRLPHERELVSAFPPGHNQHGDNHWPTMLLVAFHDVHSGLATRPSWGAMYGPGAVGEQELARQALERLPTEAIVLADGNFGIFGPRRAWPKENDHIIEVRYAFEGNGAAHRVSTQFPASRAQVGIMARRGHHRNPGHNLRRVVGAASSRVPADGEPLSDLGGLGRRSFVLGATGIGRSRFRPLAHGLRSQGTRRPSHPSR